MTQHNLTQILKVIRDLVMRNRPCYRDYLGSETTTTSTQIGAGTFEDDKGAAYADIPIEDSAFTGFILGETYTVTIDGVTADYVARNLSTISEDFGPIIGTTTTYDPESAGDPYDGWYAAAYQFEGSTVCDVVTLDTSFIGKTISISQTKTETTKRYNTKLLPEYLLPEFLRSGSVIEVVQTSGTTGGSAIILRSSTANSTKRFRITVDDTGTLQATEVTS